MVYDTAKRLAEELKASGEYLAFSEARERATENDTTRALIEEYHRLQIRAQAAAVSGGENAELMEKLRKIGELLQFDAAAAAYLMAEYRLNRMLADVYKILAEAVDIDLRALEA
ncbi:MAG: YlbF family regulator [Clostridia bacterium]|nr:YlbF family regulator [Clostridia bacterium]